MSSLVKSKAAPMAAMWAATAGLTAFWIANILKEAYPGVKSFFAFYAPVGPLLGLFILGLLVFGLKFVGAVKFEKLTLKLGVAPAFWSYVIATVLFALMVFPPIFEPVVNMLAGK